MNREEIIKLAAKAGLGKSLCHNSVEGDRVWIEGADWHDELERFASLVEERAAAAERERCVKVCEEYADWLEPSEDFQKAAWAVRQAVKRMRQTRRTTW